MGVLEVKMAKADKEDFDCMFKFFQMLEEVIERGTYTEPGSEDSVRISDEQLLRMIRQQWNVRGQGVGTAWMRVVWGCQILIDNCCDPNADTLEWRPDIEELIAKEKAEEAKSAGLVGVPTESATS